jgi:CRISPR-associated endonuclease/helicase Cas3
VTAADPIRRVEGDPLPQVLAKSRQAGRPPESLAFHSDATLRAVIEVRDRVGRLAMAEAVFGGEFWRVAQLAALAHDAGKVADGFQRMLAGGGRWGQRHEVVSLGFLSGLVPDPALRRWVASAVVTHHRPLTDGDRGRSIQHAYVELDADALRAELGPVDEERARILAAWLSRRADAARLRPGLPADDQDVLRRAYTLLHEVFAQWRSWVEQQDRGLAAVLLQGAVTLADHLSSGHGTLHTLQPVGDGFGQRLRHRIGGALHPHQEAAERAGHHLLLRAPTGSGKTEAGLLWAAARVVEIAADTGGVPRLLYMLPYLASINAMADRLTQMLPGGPEQVGVSHSRAGSYYLATAIGDEDAGDGDPRGAAARKAVARDQATRLFRETMRVGTPYQLLRGALAGAAHAGILVDCANSVFVLDELHAYDARRLGYILAMVQLWERLGGRVAVLSATLPNALAQLLRETLQDDFAPVTVGRDATPARHRVRLRDRHLTDPAAVAEISGRLEAGAAVLVVANSVRHAQELYAALAASVRERYGPEAAIMIHSRFKRGDRGRLESRIGTRYGVARGRQPGLVVSTQVVEVSLDVDFDVLFTATAPLEAVLQRFGRVNRLGRRPPADVIVHEPTYVQRRGSGQRGEFADGVYERDPVETAWEILCRHDGLVVNEPDAVGWLDEVYATGWGLTWRKEVARARREFERHFLTFPYPYDSREELEEEFDRLFDGTEAILAEDKERYEKALTQQKREDGRADRRAGRLLGEEYLIPVPYWAARLSDWDRRLKVAVIDGQYSSEQGLTAVRGPVRAADAYRPGEIV